MGNSVTFAADHVDVATLDLVSLRVLFDRLGEVDEDQARGLRYFVTETGKVIPQRISGNCAKHQRKLTKAIKRARNIALMPFTVTGK